MTYGGASGEVRLFVDGHEVQPTAQSAANMPDHVGRLRVGTWGRAGPPIAAALDELAIYDYARTPEQIGADAAAGRK